jgi:four helix bundle protein
VTEKPDPGLVDRGAMGTSKARSFEELWIWQEARKLVRDVYSDFADGNPGGRDLGFRWQIEKAAISIMNNIAEGFERETNDDFARFLDMAKGSCGEVRSMYFAAEDLKYVSGSVAVDRRTRCRPLAAGIASLAAHLRRTSR